MADSGTVAQVPAGAVAPVAVVAIASSVTPPVAVPLIVATSFEPVMVTVITWLSVPSSEKTSIVSESVAPAGSF